MHHVQEAFEVQVSVQGKTEEFLGLLCNPDAAGIGFEVPEICLGGIHSQTQRSSNSVCMVSVDFFKAAALNRLRLCCKLFPWS